MVPYSSDVSAPSETRSFQRTRMYAGKNIYSTEAETARNLRVLSVLSGSILLTAERAEYAKDLVMASILTLFLNSLSVLSVLRGFIFN